MITQQLADNGNNDDEPDEEDTKPVIEPEDWLKLCPDFNTDDDDDESTRELHADSNVFMDNPGRPGARLQLDAYLADPDLTLYVSATAVSEVSAGDKFGTQAVRLLGRPGGATIVPVPDAPTNTADLPIGGFEVNDGIIVNTAIAAGLPLLTANIKMPNQISSNPILTKHFGSATFELLG